MASLRARLAWARPDPASRIEAPDASRGLCELATASGLGSWAETLAGRSVLVRTARQIGAAQALLELDGLARRLVRRSLLRPPRSVTANGCCSPRVRRASPNWWRTAWPR